MALWVLTVGPVPLYNSQLCDVVLKGFLHPICHYPSITSLALGEGFTLTVNILVESI